MTMEQLEIHSRSYLIRYVNVPAEHTISWSIQPQKKSLNFGIFRHAKAAPPATSSDQSVQQSLTTPNPSASPPPPAEESLSVRSGRPRTSRAKSVENETMDKLHAAGLVDAYWHGRVEAEKVTTGKFDVPKGQGGVWALVFDNTFSKQVSKTATLVLLTYPTATQAPASHHLHHFDATSPPMQASVGSAGVTPRIVSSGDGHRSMESLGMETDLTTINSNSGTGFFTGVLKKRKRKKHQGFARRFFSLDFTSSTLSYYLNRESSALRGAIPLSLAAITAREQNWEIWVDSGAEVWHLRANNAEEWTSWKSALEKATRHASEAVHLTNNEREKFGGESDVPNLGAYDHAEDQGWQNMESLLGRVSGIRDAARRLCSSTQRQSTAWNPSEGLGISTSVSAATSPVPNYALDGANDRRPFWKRKTSGSEGPGLAAPAGASKGSGRKSISAGVGMSAAQFMVSATPAPAVAAMEVAHNDVRPHLQALLTDLDSLVSDFSIVMSEAKHRRWLKQRQSDANAIPATASSRRSLDSTRSEEFFDVDEFEPSRVDSHVVLVENDSESNGEAEEDFHTDDNDSSDSENEDNFQRAPKQTKEDAADVDRDLSPLPLEKIQRRETVLGSTILPPSLIGFLRKNVGKDLSSVAMPVSANEPLSLLQRISEQLEYSELLDEACLAKEESGERLLYIAAFAVSSFSGTRVKERAIRKPFNPLLGETFELVREDKGFRFLAEKVQHRPLVMACNADSEKWTFTQSPMPTQKFWGKSAELNTSGRVRISLHSTGDNFSWTSATTFLRNIIAGEKYVEPVGTMTIHHENSGDRAVVTFKAKGMFSGRSEDVSVQVLDRDGKPKPLSLHGKWTTNLAIFDDHESMVKEIWSVGAIVDNAPAKYGFTKFAASLNELTSIEGEKLAKTDSRLRPDQKMCEDGKLDEAEDVKLELEENQRSRRKLGENGEIEGYRPQWFVKVKEYADEEVWKIKSGREGYWAKRKDGTWPEGVLDLYHREVAS